MRSPLIVQIARNGSLLLALESPQIPDMELAGCKGLDSELFFSESPRLISRAKKICSNCPVILDCEKWGTRFAAHGVFGGKTPEERLNLDDQLPYYEPQVLETELWELQNTSICNLARKHGVSTRTVSRWRQTVSASLDEHMTTKDQG